MSSNHAAAPPVLSIENATLTEGSPGDLICRNLRPLDQITGYQWMKNGEPIEGETFADLFFPSSTRNDSGAYSCTATNNNGNSSVTAYLTVQCKCVGGEDCLIFLCNTKLISNCLIEIILFAMTPIGKVTSVLLCTSPLA